VITYQKVNDRTGEPKDNPVVLKSWESSEKSILKEFIKINHWDKKEMFNFIPIGFNLSYDLLVIYYRCLELLETDLTVSFLFRDLPKFDLKTIIVIANYSEFRGSTLDKFSKKKSSGAKIQELLKQKKYGKIEEYITDEIEAFLDIFKLMTKEIPPIFKKYLESNS
jgi:hypothetical protein